MVFQFPRNVLEPFKVSVNISSLSLSFNTFWFGYYLSTASHTYHIIPFTCNCFKKCPLRRGLQHQAAPSQVKDKPFREGPPGHHQTNTETSLWEGGSEGPWAVFQSYHWTESKGLGEVKAAQNSLFVEKLMFFLNKFSPHCCKPTD